MLYIHARFRGDEYKLHQEVMRTVLGLILKKVACPSHGASTFLMIAMERVNLLWLKQQPTQHSYYLQKLMSYL